MDEQARAGVTGGVVGEDERALRIAGGDAARRRERPTSLLEPSRAVGLGAGHPLQVAGTDQPLDVRGTGGPRIRQTP